MILKAFYEGGSKIGDIDTIIDWLETVTHFEFDSERYRWELETEQYDEDEEIMISNDHDCYIKCFDEENLILEVEKENKELQEHHDKVVENMKVALYDKDKEIKRLTELNRELTDIITCLLICKKDSDAYKEIEEKVKKFIDNEVDEIVKSLF